MNYQVTIVRTLAAFLALGASSVGRLVADVETFGNDPRDGKLLGLAIAPLEGKFADGSDAAYVVIQEYLYQTSEWRSHIDYSYHAVRETLEPEELVGFNYCYDKAWLEHFFKMTTAWHADARLMWHRSERHDVTRPYNLKLAQTSVLGWSERGDAELAEQVKARGGSLKKGDHYLADTDVLGRYAGLDAISTALLYKARKPFFDEHGIWNLLERDMRAAAHLDENTRIGVRVDETKLQAETEKLATSMVQARRDLARSVEPYVRRLVEGWRDDQAARYETNAGRTAFLSDTSRWKKFNPASDKQKRELFYGVMGLPIADYVKPRKDRKTGKRVRSTTPASTYDAVVRSVAASGRSDLAPMIDAYRRSEESETLLKNFAGPWLKAIRAGRIHPPFNSCGTVSFRISGFKPYFLNLPFDEKELMSCFSCDEGHSGVHADLVSVEPAVTAHYSQDPALLKVFRDGLGDVYLDLALTLFPGDVDLHAGYDPSVPCTADVKERFKKQRKVAKIVQLAVQYTGTEHTVHLNLTKAGWRGTLDDAAALVARYWLHFAAVRRMNENMRRLHARRGFIRNVVGRPIMVSQRFDKDIPNRVIQSSGHDILTTWNLHTYELCRERRVAVRPVLWDCHDSNSNQAPTDQADALEQAMRDALDRTNADLRMTVPVRADFKRFHTLAGLKGAEA